MNIFKNVALSFTCAPTKTEVFECHNVLHHILIASRMLCEGCSRIFIVMFLNDSNTLRLDEYFFANGGKNLRFQKYPVKRICEDRALNMEHIR